MKFVSSTLAAMACTAVLSTPVAANPADVTRVTEGLIAAGMAIELSEQCDSVGVRYLRGINFLQGLKSHLEDLGYSDAQIDAYIDNRDEKRRLEGIARARLADLGATAGDSASHCSVARTQISQGTQVGQLLR